MTGVGVLGDVWGVAAGTACGRVAWARAQADANIQVKNMRSIENRPSSTEIMAKKRAGELSYDSNVC
jgi:hypothetical protein